MKTVRLFLAMLLASAAPALASVTVSSPVNNSTVNSPVHYVASASSACSKGIAAVGVYVNNQLAVKQTGASLNASLAFSNGYYSTVVQEWDNCGGSSTATVNITVGSGNTGTTTAVTVSSPANNSTVSSPVTFSAKATTATCVKGIAAMGVYVDNTLAYQTNGAAVQTSLAIANGLHHAVVQAWDNCGGAFNTPVTFTVQAANATAVNISASPTSIASGASSVLTVTASNATQVTIKGSDGTSYALSTTGGKQTVTPKATTTYTATATGSTGTVSSTATVTVAASSAPTVTVSANPTSIGAGSSSTLTVSATNASAVTVTGSNGTTYNLAPTGGTQVVSPAATTTYTAKATGSTTSATSTTTVTVVPAGGQNAINHVVFMLQENHSFDNYFGMLNPYRAANHWNVGSDGLTYNVDGIDDKLANISNQSDEGTNFSLFKFVSTCVDDLTSSWLESYGDVNRYDFSTTRTYPMDGFVHTAENFAKNCSQPGSGCSGTFSDLNGKRAMGYYDQGFLNYYYYMASQFAVSDRWFSPISTKSIPNRIATFSGGTTQGLAFDPGSNDHLGQLNIATIFSELDTANVPWKIYYTTTQGGCTSGGTCTGSAAFPDTIFTYFSYSGRYLYQNPNKTACTAPTQPSSVVGDTSNSFCIDPARIAPMSAYYTDLKNRTLPSFSFIEAGAGVNDEHPGSGQSVLSGQVQVATVVNALMTSPSWSDSAFFLSYDEGGGPYDHVPAVPGHSNQNTDSMVGSASVQSIPDISTIAVNADSYGPCVSPGGVPTLHCDLPSINDPAGHSTDAPARQGFAAQLGFRVPNLIISPYTRKHYVGHTPMDHTAILKFVENRFIGPSAHLTARDAAQPNLLDFFDFTSAPWATPPTPPAPVTPQSLGYDPCTPQTF